MKSEQKKDLDVIFKKYLPTLIFFIFGYLYLQLIIIIIQIKIGTLNLSYSIALFLVKGIFPYSLISGIISGVVGLFYSLKRLRIILVIAILLYFSILLYFVFFGIASEPLY